MRSLHISLLSVLLIHALHVQSCIDHEREALLKFKAGVSDPSNRLASWSGDKCCNWAGIRCHNQTGHVVHLDLRNHNYSPRNLDMSWVDLHGSKEWAQSLNKLPSLEVLILEYNHLTYIPQSLSSVNFTSLRVLHLYGQNFNTTIPNWIFRIQSLITLNLGYSGFVGLIPDALGNLTSLSNLVLESNSLYGKIPPLYNLTKLKYLDLSDIIIGEHINVTEITNGLSRQTLRRMEGLILRGCNLNGNLIELIAEMSNLKYLDLSNNYLSGAIPDSIGNLTNLVELHLSDNLFVGSLTDLHLYRLSKLDTLSLENNPISIAMKNNWQPSFQLRSLQLGSCKVGPKFPAWLQNQLKIEIVNLSNTQIDDLLPRWFWGLKSLKYLDLSNNEIRGKLSESVANVANLTQMDLNGNQLEGEVPSSFSDYLEYIDLSNNRFEQLPKMFQAPGLLGFYLSNNNFSGTIQLSLCRLTRLKFLDFSSNNLFGYLPNCLPSLEELNLGNNKISGTIPR